MSRNRRANRDVVINKIIIVKYLLQFQDENPFIFAGARMWLDGQKNEMIFFVFHFPIFLESVKNINN